MKAIWAEVLAGDLINAGAINAESDFFHVGGTSMLLIEVQAQIRKQLGVLIVLVHLFRSSTLRAMARLVEQNMETTNDTAIDWVAETSLPSPLPAPSAQLVPRGAAPRIVLLTGATGFLGAQLLKELVATPGIEKVICIAIRHLARRIQNNELPVPQGRRVAYYEGDLQAPRLGLSEADAAAIFPRVDAVIHNGADVSHLKNYTSLRAANVGSTRELIRLTASRRVPIHYVSTAGVAMFTDRERSRRSRCATRRRRRTGSTGTRRRSGRASGCWSGRAARRGRPCGSTGRRASCGRTTSSSAPAARRSSTCCRACCTSRARCGPCPSRTACGARWISSRSRTRPAALWGM